MKCNIYRKCMFFLCIVCVVGTKVETKEGIIMLYYMQNNEQSRCFNRLKVEIMELKPFECLKSDILSRRVKSL